MKNKMIVGIIVFFVMVLGMSFYAGIKYSQISRSFPGFSGRNFSATDRVNVGDNLGRFDKGSVARGSLGGMIGGEIISKDETGLTVKSREGGSRIIFISEKTTIMKVSTSTKEELVNGLQVSVFGKTNPDGSITAENIQIR